MLYRLDQKLMALQIIESCPRSFMLNFEAVNEVFMLLGWLSCWVAFSQLGLDLCFGSDITDADSEYLAAVMNVILLNT